MIKQVYEYKELKRTTTEKQRLYTCPDGNAVPSVTTILDKTKSEEKKAGLARWRKSVGEAKAKEIVTEADRKSVV